MALVESIRALTPDFRLLAADIERDRSVPDRVMDQLAALGVFRLAAPAAAGGVETDPLTMLDVLEELGYADGSIGWCAMIGAATGVALGRLPVDVAAELVSDPRFLIVGVAAPMGRARAVPGGYQVTGRWPFASACRHASRLVGGCLVMTDDGPSIGVGGAPEVRLMIMRPAELTIHDTWHVTGLRGTGSHDIEAADVFVPVEHTISLAEPPVAAGPIFTFPVLSLLAFGIGAVALGIARAAIDEFTTLMRSKVNPMTRTPLASKPATRTVLAQAVALHDGGLAYLRSELSSNDSGPRRRARLRIAIATATRNAAAAVDLLYNAAGGSAIYESSPLQRHFRDIHVATQHAMVNPDVLEYAGAVLFDEAADSARL